MSFVGLLGSGLALYNHSLVQGLLCGASLLAGQYLNVTGKGKWFFNNEPRIGDFDKITKRRSMYKDE